MVRQFFVCLLAVIVIQIASVHRATLGQPSDNGKRVKRAETRPDLAIQLENVAQVKIATRKTNFQIGEMITLDVALLNTSGRPLFFRKLSEVRLNALNDAGLSVSAQEYGVADRALVPARFVRLSPGEMSVHSFSLLAGCDERAFAQFASSETSDRSVFNNGLFLNWGDACLRTRTPGTYAVTAEIENTFVLVPSRTKDAKTAVGKIRSNSLKISLGN